MAQIVETLTQHGLGRLGDGTLIPRVLPGEEVTIDEDGSARLVTPTVTRVKPVCRHFKACGGCAMQHAADDFVADWKVGIVKRALDARGMSAEFRPIATSPTQSRRRAKFSATRTKKGALVGFHARGSGVIIAIPDCQLVRPALTALIPALEKLTVLAASRKAEIALTVTDSLAGPDVWVETEKPLTADLRITLAQFAQENGLARLTVNDEPVVTISGPSQVFGAARVTPPPGAFLQATSEGEADLLGAVQQIVGKADSVVDLFAGSGTFSLPLAQSAEVDAFEGDAAMIAALDLGWRNAQGLKRVTGKTRDLFRRPLLPDELNRYAAAVIDPPRAGAEAQIEQIAESKIKTVAMVSCNPVTFARDAQVLVDGGFTLGWVQVVDQFRWSPHVEMVAQFTRR